MEHDEGKRIAIKQGGEMDTVLKQPSLVTVSDSKQLRKKMICLASQPKSC